MTAERWITVALGFSIVASIGLVVTYLLGGQAQVEGMLLAVALGGLGAALVIWAASLLDAKPESEEVHPLASPQTAREAAWETLSPDEITRRGFLLRLMAGAVAALAAALAIPALSLGPQPGRALFRTDWQGGARLVGADGEPVRVADLGLEAVRTVFPEGHVGSPDAQTLLIRVSPATWPCPTGAPTGRPRVASHIRRSVRTPAARWGCTGPKIMRCCARATSRPSTSCAAPFPRSDPPCGPCPNCR